MQNLYKTIFGLFLVSLCLVAVLAAPLKGDTVNDEQLPETDKVDKPLTSLNEEKQETATKTKEETPEAAEPEVNKDAPEEDDGRGQEVINYQDIQVDHNSKVTSENMNQELGSKDEEEDEEDELEDEVEDEDIDVMPRYMLTPAEARELMIELRDPVEVAKFVVETDDAEGFLRALRLLMHDGYITPEQAYSLKDEVALQLRNLLMLQQVELSRALFETYQAPVEEDPSLDLENILYPDSEETQPIDYYDYANMIDQDAPYDGPMPDNLYETYQEQIEQESSLAIVEIAEILAQRISKGEITPEEGTKIWNKVIQMLPESYWAESNEDELTGSESMPSEYPFDQGFNEDSVMEAMSEDEDAFSYMDDKETDEGDYEEEEEPSADDDEEKEEENFEEELLEHGPDGLDRVIEEQDENGDEDAKELEAQAEQLADELADELRQGGQTGAEKTMEIERPGAKAIVKVGPSNDVTKGKDLREDWKEMSLLLNNDIPDEVLRNLGISLEKEASELKQVAEDAVNEEQE